MEEFFMREALKEAKKGFEKLEVPVGAVLVYQNEIVARGHNQVELLNDATAHAEMICIRLGSSLLSNWRLKGATLYCTLEPCAMCAGAMILSRLDGLVWGAPDLRHGAGGSLFNILNEPHPIHCLKVRGGVLKEECAALMKEFFKKRRVCKKSLMS